MKNINPHNIQRHGQLWFWRNPDGSRSTNRHGHHFTFRKCRDGWEGYGKTFRTLVETFPFVDNFHLFAHLIPDTPAPTENLEWEPRTDAATATTTTAKE